MEITETKKGYKQTRLGWIPEDWEVYRFDEVFNSFQPIRILEINLLRANQMIEMFLIFTMAIYTPLFTMSN